jgi:hypothetical protein
VNERAIVKLNAPNGKVTIQGHVEGRAILIAKSPGGVFLVARTSGKFDEDARVTVIAKTLNIQGAMSGNAQLSVSLTGGGTVSMGPMEGNAVVVYNK